MEKSQPQKNQIKYKMLHLLQNAEFGKTPFEMARLLNISRQTAKKYLKELEEEKKIKKFEAGHYDVYMFVRPRDDLLFEKLYFFLLSIINNIQKTNPGLIEPIIAQFQRNRHKLIREIDFPSKIQIPDLSRQQKTFDNLLALMEGVRYFLFTLIPSIKNYSIEIIPALDKIKPLSLEMRVEDPGFIIKQAGFHYEIVASIIQERLSVLAGSEVFFRVSRPLRENLPHVYFELGYVDRYFQDFSILEFNNNETTERELLNEIKTFYSAMSRLDAEESLIDGRIHYKLTFHNNHELEQLYEILMHSAEENTKIGKQLLQESPHLLIRKWIPIESWSHPPFAVIECVSNFGYIVDEYIRLSSESHKFFGLCIHFERIESGWRINCMEKVDFEQLFAPITDWKRRRAVYEKLTPHPDEFLKRRNEMIKKNRKEHERKRKDLEP
ncbi:MAG: HTH domain-containing protein [Candidatus Sigynarchaeota archaeon]